MKKIFSSLARVKCSRIVSAFLLALAVCLLLFVGIQFYFTMTSADAKRVEREQREYFKALEEQESTPAAERAWKRLHRKHGQPGAVVYEPGQTPYYVDRQGRKCRFI